MITKIIKNMLGVIVILGFLVLTGIAGGFERESLALGTGVIYGLATMLAMALAIAGIERIERREGASK